MEKPTLHTIRGKSVILSDLDGLLVNSENFNQVFIQRADPYWIHSTIKRVVKSEVHLKKLIQVLTKFIVSERHPEWGFHALKWLKELVEHYLPLIQSTPMVREACQPLLSYGAETMGLASLYNQAAIRGTVAESWVKMSHRTTLPSCYSGLSNIPSTGYVFVDDSDEEAGPHALAPSSNVKSLTPGSPTAGLEDADVDLMDSFSEGDDSEIEDDTEHLYESDHGVFDVNETASSEDQQPVLSTERTSDQIYSDSEFANVDDGAYTSVFFKTPPRKPGALVSSSDDEENGDTEASDDGSTESEELDLLMWTRQDDEADDNDQLSDPALEEEAQTQRTSNEKGRGIANKKRRKRGDFGNKEELLSATGKGDEAHSSKKKPKSRRLSTSEAAVANTKRKRSRHIVT
ncbi:unnamed protein product [Calicophoron daubneyi]|uniref:Uncharacterized protein n=1 Tax=Calicophoron daubneyi TaxID=300641 RepID=A0AAV2T7S5_CALDB